MAEKTNNQLKKSGEEKLKKIGKTTDVAHISYGVRHGKITIQEAAALDPKNFKHLLEDGKTTKTITVDMKTGKTRIGNMKSSRGGGAGGGVFGPEQLK
jgi:hypothetical protein